MCRRYPTFLFILIILSVDLMSHAHAADPVNVRLLQSIDEDCDGRSQVMSSSSVMPGACIRYRLVVSNTGNLPVVSTHVAAFVPDHTQLYSPLTIVSGRSLVSDASEEAYSSTVLGMRLGQMQPGVVTLQYAVRVNH